MDTIDERLRFIKAQMLMTVHCALQFEMRSFLVCPPCDDIIVTMFIDYILHIIIGFVNLIIFCLQFFPTLYFKSKIMETPNLKCIYDYVNVSLIYLKWNMLIVDI